MNRYNIMWTGGLDSTYTMVIYSREEVEIQPYYFMNGRKSEKYEIRAMESILQVIKSHPETRALIRSPEMIDAGSIPQDNEVEQAYKKLKEKGGLGSQYCWIASYVKNSGLDRMFYSAVKPLGYTSKLRLCIEENGGFSKEKNNSGRTYYTIDHEKSTKELELLFGHFCFSETFDITKPDEERLLREMGYGDAVDSTWICHTPVMGKPCGCCNPCGDAIEAGQTWRFTKSELKRYKQYKSGVSPWRVRLGSYLDALFGR
ncbi:MAG: hypothetical protein K5668_11640 [Lachnospiraceae bacterium]|nr:hypothetical protein [Lachnospiraceae bacterium]